MKILRKNQEYDLVKISKKTLYDNRLEVYKGLIFSTFN